jgi:3-deoxy-D-manno-octulosonic-acid transferase
LDTIGELRAIYELATVAFVGGSLAPVGGHNILEPAQFGVPVLVGPHTENFRDMVTLFQRADALTIVEADTFAPLLVDLLRDSTRRTQLGDRARQLFESQSGATSRTMAVMEELLPPGGTAPR